MYEGCKKYIPFKQIELPDREWPNKTITKTFRKIDENTGELIIRDNGVGINKTKKDMNRSLGCEIIRSLTKQLDGEIKYLDDDEGTGFRLLFPLTMEHTISKSK